MEAGQIPAEIELRLTDCGDALLNCNVGQTATNREYRKSEIRNASRNRDIGKAAGPECQVADTGDSFGKRYRFKVPTIIKGISPEAGNTVGEGNANQTGTVGEGVVANIRKGARNRQIRQPRTRGRGIIRLTIYSTTRLPCLRCWYCWPIHL